MKWVYSIIIAICLIFLMIIYFSNVIWLGNMNMYLGSQSNRISVASGLGLIVLVSIILGASIVLLVKSLIKPRPKDFDEMDF
jgi:hypothetical protein